MTGRLADILQQDNALSQSPRLKELHCLMSRIRERNERLTPQLTGIMAVQRDELNKMRQGSTMLQGYAAPAQQTGKHLSSAG